MAFKLKIPRRRKPGAQDRKPAEAGAGAAPKRKMPALPKLKAGKLAGSIKDRVKSPKGKAKSQKKFKAVKGARFVIMIGDEGAILVHIKGNVVQSRQFIPDASADNLKEFAGTLAKDSKAPILLAIDSMDQSYVQQTLPPVSAMSVNKLIKRRLDRDFAVDDIKGALSLGREKSGRKDWNFLMISLEKSPQLKVWLDFVSDLPNRFLGIYLIAVEVEMLIKTLDQALGNDNAEVEWKFFVSHNKVGGYRQVILRHGRVLFTRLAQPLGESTPEMIAGNIEQEIISTIEYMKRLSYDGQSGLDIYIIGSSSVKPLIDASRLNASSLHFLTPFEIAQMVGIEGATQPTDQFGDVILASYIGASKKHVLTLTTPQSKKIDGLYQLLYYQRIGAVLGVLGLIGTMGSEVMDIYQAYAKSSELGEQKTLQQHKLEIVKLDISHSQENVGTMNDVIDLYRQLLMEQVSPLPFLMHLGSVINMPVRLSGLEWGLGEDKNAKPSATPTMAATGGVTGAATDDTMHAKLNIEFNVSETDALKTAVPKTLEAVKAGFNGYNVAYMSQPTIMENEKVELNFNDAAPAASALSGKALQAEMAISGKLMVDEKAVSPAGATAAPALVSPTEPYPVSLP